MGKFKGLFSKIVGDVEVNKTDVKFTRLNTEVKKLMYSSDEFVRFMQKGKVDTKSLLVSYTLTKFENQKVFTAKIESDEMCTCCREQYLKIKMMLPLDFKFSSTENIGSIER